MRLKNQKLLRNRLMSLLCGLAVVTFITSCDDDDDVVVDPADVAYVSLYNASPNSPDLDVIVDNRQINVYPFDYADYTGYLRFYTGERNLQFGPYNASNIVEDTTVTFEDDQAYSVFIVDEYPDIDALILEDNADNPEDGNAMIRFIHLSPDAPAVDLAVEDETDPLFDNLDFKEPTDFTEVSAGEYDFEVRTEADNEVVLSVPNINIQSGWFYTIIVRGFADSDNGDTALSADVLVN